jgi:hypothetical protein
MSWMVRWKAAEPDPGPPDTGRLHTAEAHRPREPHDTSGRSGCDTDDQLPEHQHVAVGDLICDRPNYAWYFRVQRVDSQHPLVYRSIRHTRRGSPIDITDPQSPRQAEQQLPEAGAYIDFAWALAPGPWRKNEPPAAWRGCQYVPGQATRRAAGLPDTAAGPGRRDIRSSDAAGDRQARGRPELPAT